MEERPIGATELRQKLTDVIQSVREQNAAYIVETFGRPQVVIIGLDEYRRLQSFRRTTLGEKTELARSAFGMWAERDDIDEDWPERQRRWVSAWNEDAADE